MRRDLAVCLLLLLCTAAVYGQTAGHAFIQFDDNAYVYENPHVRRGLTWEGVAWSFTTLQASNWHPLTWLSHMLDCEIFGLNAGYHHLVNVLLHILNSVLLYLVLKRMTGAIWRSVTVAALFSLHPLHVESVAWIAERKDVLSTLFFMLTLWAYARYASRPSWPRYWAVFGALALGLMAKPMLVTVPLVLLLLDYWPLGRFHQMEDTGTEGSVGIQHMGQGNRGARAMRLLFEKVPLLALAATSSVITFVAQQRGGATAPSDVAPLGLRAANAVVSYAAYVGKMLWPRHLAFFYPYRDSVTTAEWMVPALLLVGVSVLVIRASRRWRYLAVGWFWYLGTLVPVIGLVQVGRQSMADRYTYVPLIGLFLMGVWGTADLATRWRHGRTVLAGAAGGVLIACMVGAWVRVSYWQDGITLFGQALQVTEGNALAHNNLGLALQERGRAEEAIAHYEKALRIDPAMDNAHGNLGNALLEQGRREEGMRHYKEALRINPASAKAHNNLGNEFMGQGQTKKAIEHYQKALQINPEQAATHSNMGNALMTEGRPDEAMAHYLEALRIDPEFANAHNNLGLSLARQGKRDEAIVHLREALQLNPDYADGHYNLGVLLAGQGRLEEAIDHYREAVRIDPTYARAQYELGAVSLRQGKRDEAIAHFRIALAGDSEYPEAHRSLALVLADQGNPKEAIEHYLEAIRLRPDDPGAYNNLAWIRATHPDPELRNGAEAVRLAERACALWKDREPNLLDTLAAAYAEAGRFPEAVETLEEAISLAASAGPEERVRVLGARLQVYRAGRPYRQARNDARRGEP
jgi:tetratricopeptide (TPR) repeat protein